jgi:hypothetical protein
MARRIHLRTDISNEELERRYRSAKEPHEHSWWQILWPLSRGHSARQVAQSTGYLSYWIGQLAKCQPHPGPCRHAQWRPYRLVSPPPPLLNAAQQEELRVALLSAPPTGQALWTGRLVAAWISERLGRRIGVQRGWDYLCGSPPWLDLAR